MRRAIFTLLASLCFFITAAPALAAEPAQPYSSGSPTQHQLIVPIGTLTKNDVAPGDYINAIYKWGIGLAAILAMGQLVLGGVLPAGLKATSCMIQAVPFCVAVAV